MRVLIFIYILAFSAFAQETIFVKQTYEAANSAAREKRYEQAIKQYRMTILRAETEHLKDALLAKIHFNIGVCLYHLKRTDEAVAEYAAAIKLSKRQYQRAFYALGMAQKDLRHWREAAAALRDALKIDRTDGEAWFDLAMIYLQAEEFTSAEKAFAKSIKHKSVNAPDAHNNLGVIAAFADDWATAEKKFETALLASEGRLTAAAKNLRFCKFYKQNIKNKDWLAKLRFSGTDKGE